LERRRSSPDVISRPPTVDGVELVESGCTEDVEDEGELVVVVSSREDRLSREHFSEDASDGPDVDGLMR